MDLNESSRKILLEFKRKNNVSKLQILANAEVIKKRTRNSHAFWRSEDRHAEKWGSLIERVKTVNVRKSVLNL